MYKNLKEISKVKQIVEFKEWEDKNGSEFCRWQARDEKRKVGGAWNRKQKADSSDREKTEEIEKKSRSKSVLLSLLKISPFALLLIKK